MIVVHVHSQDILAQHLACFVECTVVFVQISVTKFEMSMMGWIGNKSLYFIPVF